MEKKHQVGFKKLADWSLNRYKEVQILTSPLPTWFSRSLLMERHTGKKNQKEKAHSSRKWLISWRFLKNELFHPWVKTLWCKSSNCFLSIPSFWDTSWIAQDQRWGALGGNSFAGSIISVRTYVFHLLRTYVMILCNWLIHWQKTLYLYLGKFRMF